MGDKMSDKKEERNVIATTRQFERIKIIHEHIKNMEYPNVPRLVEIINARANTMLASGDYNHYESGENRQN